LISWAEDCKRPNGNTAVLYVAGHGVYDPKAGQKLLLEDLTPQLSTARSIDLSSVKEGLEHLHLEASYVFVDSCAAELDQSRNYGGGGVCFPYYLAEDRPRCVFAFASARRGSNAYGIRGGTSVFLHDLVGALDRGGAVAADAKGHWVVNSYALASALARSMHPDQHPWPGAEGEDFVFHVQEKPIGWVKVTLVPPEDAAKFDVSIQNNVGQYDFPIGPLRPHPYEKEVHPGVHVVQLLGVGDKACDPRFYAEPIPPHETFQAEFTVSPP
jgi:hypothetical protein